MRTFTDLLHIIHPLWNRRDPVGTVSGKTYKDLQEILDEIHLEIEDETWGDIRRIVR